ncbi:hypothetical protein [Oscillibacter sp. MSJ-31]|uniref:hypothetical protein n=1 Tax=Oscillibacter sp. MSJ-31 TaxID=2841526 RepID=UPI001C0F4356|nr:hypothetical protein [Oscillibacter sp. MSJ-31]MBU5457580.1 hypothetical protein [Oscillibacter sp. MSJ-31]
MAAHAEMKKLTRAMRGTIREIVFRKLEDNEPVNENDIMSEVCMGLGNKFSGGALDYQLERMGIKTTNDVRLAVQAYMWYYFDKDLNTYNKMN